MECRFRATPLMAESRSLIANDANGPNLANVSGPILALFEPVSRNSCHLPDLWDS